MLDPRHAQALHTRTVDRALPRGEFLERQRIAFAHFVDRQQAAIDRRDDFRLAPNDLAGRGGRRQHIQAKGFPERPDHHSRTDFLVLDHLYPQSPVVWEPATSASVSHPELPLAKPVGLTAPNPVPWQRP